MQTAGEATSRSWGGEVRDFLAGKTPYSFLLLVLALSVTFTLRGLRHDSPTEDEWAHLVRGINYWQNRDMRIHVQHPPLANALDGLPSAFDHNPDLTQMKTWQEGYVPGYEYIKQDYAKARQQLARGRYVAMLFLLGMVAYIFHFCLKTFGWPTAAAAACLVAFNPTLIGQARYVATDLPVTTFAAIATGELARYLTNTRRIWSLGLALSGLVLTKHSGIVLLLMLVVVALAAAAFGKGIFRGQPLVKRLLRWLGHFAIAGAIVVFSINAVYKFYNTGMTVQEILDAPEPQHWVTERFHNQMLERNSPLPKLPKGLRIPLPYPYLFGLFAVQQQDAGGYPSYFMGSSERDGNWAYFPVLLLTKDPPALLLLLALGGVIWLRSFVLRLRRRSTPSSEAAPPRETFFAGLSIPSACFFAVAAMFLLFIMRSHLNMGIRHGLPVMPLASVLGGRAFARADELLSGYWLLGARVLGLSAALSALLAGSTYLNYYNFIALGRGSYINVVGDDWGQDREAFVRFVKEKNLQPLYYHTQTPTRRLEVEFLGLKYEELSCRTKPKPGSWVAIHAQYVHRWEADKKCNRLMESLEPIYRVNDNVWIYRAR